MADAALLVVVCGPEGTPGVSYIQLWGQPAPCGNDAAGNELSLQLSPSLVMTDAGTQSGSGDGTVAGLAIGGAVLGVMALAFCLRLLRNFFNSSAEG